MVLRGGFSARAAFHLDTSASIKIVALALFSLMALIQLYPLSLHPHNALNDTGDCLLNTWILTSVSRQLFSNPLKIFEANAFYPYSHVISYSEHLLPPALLFSPVYHLTQNPVLAYNFVFFLCVVLNGYAMFLFLKSLTRSDIAGLAGGVMFAFNTYQVQHITHVQLLTSWLIPLSLLYLHKFIQEKRLKHSILFSLFFTLQALSCIYYGLFFISILFLAVPVVYLLQPKKWALSSWISFLVPISFSGLILLGFSIPYLSLFRTFGFKRDLAQGADLVNYLSVIPNNVILGKLLSPLGSNEYFLFPGIAAVLLAGYLVFLKRKVLWPSLKWLRSVLAFTLFITIGFAILIIVTRGFLLKIGPLSISGHNPGKPVYGALVVLSLWVLTAFGVFLFNRNAERTDEIKNTFLYLILLFWALHLSFGSSFVLLAKSPAFRHYRPGFFVPFKWFYDHVPGFKGIRVPARYGIFVIFCLIVLAAYGLKNVLQAIRKKEIKIAFSIGLIVFLNLEYLAIPHQIKIIPVSHDVPPTYAWIKNKPGDFAVVELPFFKKVDHEAKYMYLSLYHGKRMINGYSGFIPLSTFYIRRVFDGFPSQASLDILKALNIKYAIVHPKLWGDEKAPRVMDRLNNKYANELKKVAHFKYETDSVPELAQFLGNDLIYEVSPRSEPQPIPPECQEIPRSDWEVKASIRADLLPKLKDDRLDTAWTTARVKRTNDHLIVEFKQPRPLIKASLFLGQVPTDFAQDLKVETSSDGVSWQSAPRAYSPGEFTLNLIHSPKDPVQHLSLKGKLLRYLKITQIGDDPEWSWSVAELKLYEPRERARIPETAAITKGKWGESLYEFINLLRHTDLSARVEKLREVFSTYRKPKLCESGARP
jgi:hypothetical protein